MPHLKVWCSFFLFRFFNVLSPIASPNVLVYINKIEIYSRGSWLESQHGCQVLVYVFSRILEEST